MSGEIVTRFAPSPTGYLHVGGARTAIFNWLWARHTGGKFVLRIEDTDIKRNTPTAMQQLIDDLRWLGIDWDEGPEVDGPNGPYLQSQRKEQGIYDKYVDQLLQEGKAYYCFDTPEELDAMREKAVAQKKNLMYRRPDKFPDENEVKKAKAQGKSVVVRFAMPQDQDIVVQDLVRGAVRFAAGEMGDFIIRKSDGFPTYNFACVVDDYLMKATHVIRGQEHLMNTPGQQALWQALGFGPLPKYAHMSVTVSQGGGKLSKRERPEALRQAAKARPDIDPEKLAEAAGISASEVQSFIEGESTPDMPSIDAMAGYLGVTLPEINVVDFFRSGYLPETMMNFLALLGWNPGGDREIMSVHELVDSFDLSRVTKANSLFDRQKLIAFNTEHLRTAPKERLIVYLRNYLRAVDSPIKDALTDKISWMIERSQGARTLAHIDLKWRAAFVPRDQVKIKYYDETCQKVLNKDGKILPAIRNQLETVSGDITATQAETTLRALANQHQVGLGKVAQPLRVALCGSTVSASVFDLVELLGKEETKARIDNAIQVIQGKAVI